MLILPALLIILQVLPAKASNQSNTSAAVKEIPPPISVENFCESYSGQSHFLEQMSKEILKDNKRRIKLVELMNSKHATGCREALSDYLKEIIKDDSNLEGRRGFEAYLALAFTVHLPEATELIEKEIDKGKLVDWIDVVQNSDKEAYFSALSHWVQKVAVLIRQITHGEAVDEKLYGRISGNEQEILTPEAIPIWNAIIVHKYMAEVMSRRMKLTKNEFAYLNILYAASNQSYREIFLKEMSSIVELSDVNWVTDFREEPTWVQFRLFPIMAKTRGGVVKRELIWLSNNHQEFRIRALAQSTLEKVNARPR